MPTFLFTATDESGNSVTDRVEAGTTSAARYKLGLQGYSKISFHTDELAADFDKFLGEGLESPVAEVLSPEDELAARRGGGVLREIAFAWKANTLFWLPLFVWSGLAVYHGRPYTLSDWLSFVFTGLFLFYFVWMVLPGIAYQKLLSASVWYQWNDVRRWARIIRILKRLAFIPIPDLELDFRLAYALAAEGQLEKGLALVNKYEDHKCGKFMFYSRVSSVYEAARNYEKMTACRKLAAHHGTGKPAEKIDIVLGLLRRQRNITEAKPLLAELEETDVAEIGQLFVEYCRGLLAVEERDWQTAEKLLNETLNLAALYANNVLMDGMTKDIKAYLGIAVANLGKQEQAKSIYREVAPLLKVRKEDELLERLRGSIVQPV